jgi:type VI secretion system FHA domain protein
MSLTLEVIGEKAARMGGAVRKTFTAGGTIGRLADNDWVLPDEYISGHHARVSFTDGVFFIEDTSTNGVFVNTQLNRLPRGKPHPLRNGDTIFIDDYEVQVALAADSVAIPGFKPTTSGPFEAAPGAAGAPNATDPIALLGLQTTRPIAAGPSAASLQNSSVLAQHYQPPSVTAPPPPPVAAKSAGPGFIPDDYDPMGAEDDPFAGPPPAQRSPPRPVAAPPATPAVPPRSATASTVFTGPLRPKPGIRSPSEIRGAPPPKPGRRPNQESPPASSADPFDGVVSSARPNAIGVGQGSAPMPPPRPSASAAQKVRPPAKEAAPAAAATAAPTAAATDGAGESRAAPAPNAAGLDFASLLQAAGIESMRITPELSQQFGKILRVVVTGLMDVLRARDKIKDEFRMRMTTFKQTDNNPLKFSANVEDALHNLLVKRNAAYLGPVEAFEDAFLDVRNHQMAMLAGVRVAYEAMLAEFDPERLQEIFEPQAKGANFFSGGAKARYWELYRNRFHDMVKDADSSFRNLFGDDFAKAYEEQLARLRAANQAGRK